MTEDELDLQRGRYPLGAHITGRVSHIPRPGAIGLFVDLGEPPGGFVDVLNLPYAADEWPTVGTEATFEVVQHRVGQVRLWPLDPELRTTDPVGRSTEQLHARYPVGSDITGVVPRSSRRTASTGWSSATTVRPSSGRESLRRSATYGASVSAGI